MSKKLIHTLFYKGSKDPFIKRVIMTTQLHILCGCSLVVKPQPSKLMMRVRFPSPAPYILVPVAQQDRATAF
jgi:hypothetical protein